ncbi:NAD(+) synthase [Acetobacter orientalis]|uniref:NAD(+) synthase n=1 Tax=Acetobacter orientalis TaxID=146474 RepID=A0A2Z5ZIF9_9PROT|nr:NAD(+) synthase [Acetobacter orientalis]
MSGSVFRALYHHGFARVAACTLPVALADPATNMQRTRDAALACAAESCALCVFPELGISGYALDDLRQQEVLLHATEQALTDLAAATTELLPVLIVGAPLRYGSALYNCAVVLHRGAILGVVPKSFLPNYREFYEVRHFTPGAGLRGQSIRIGTHTVPFGTDLLFDATDLPNFCLGIEICEDLWVPAPPVRLPLLPGLPFWPTPPPVILRWAKLKLVRFYAALTQHDVWPLIFTPPQAKGNRPPMLRGTARLPFLKTANSLPRASAFQPVGAPLLLILT